jgi:hypothetical protein
MGQIAPAADEPGRLLGAGARRWAVFVGHALVLAARWSIFRRRVTGFPSENATTQQESTRVVHVKPLTGLRARSHDGALTANEGRQRTHIRRRRASSLATNIHA